LELGTRGRGLYAFDREAAQWLRSLEAGEGLLSAFVQHTSASLLIQENADPAVQADLERFFARLVKDGDPLFEHDAEGPDDMPSHLRSAVTRTGEVVPVSGGRLSLGTWQAIYLWEHRTAPHRRRIVVTVTGTGA
jgi:secondary thiamine-phosphate synthase enzyme